MAAFTTYLSTITAAGTGSGQSQQFLKYLMPLVIFWSGRSFAAGLTLYWVVSNIFQIMQQRILMERG